MTKHVFDKIVVIDLEATCWEGAPPAGEEGEIIEIGVTLLDIQSRERTDKRSILVRPTISQVTPFCTALTGHTAESLSAGITFSEACGILKADFSAHKRPWASWGEYDRTKFLWQCERFRVPYPLDRRHINVKPLFAACLGLKREVGVRNALELTRKAFTGREHRGDDDAWNIADLLGTVLSGNYGRALGGSSN